MKKKFKSNEFNCNKEEIFMNDNNQLDFKFEKFSKKQQKKYEKIKCYLSIYNLNGCKIIEPDIKNFINYSEEIIENNKKLKNMKKKVNFKIQNIITYLFF